MLNRPWSEYYNFVFCGWKCKKRVSELNMETWSTSKTENNEKYFASIKTNEMWVTWVFQLKSKVFYGIFLALIMWAWLLLCRLICVLNSKQEERKFHLIFDRRMRTFLKFHRKSIKFFSRHKIIFSHDSFEFNEIHQMNDLAMFSKFLEWSRSQTQ